MLCIIRRLACHYNLICALLVALWLRSYLLVGLLNTIKMGCLPVTSKCCFCVPLRPGLLAWAYIRLCAAVALLLYNVYIACIYWGVTVGDRLTFVSGVIFLSVVSVVFSGVFVIGLHIENYKMILVFYWFSMLELLTTMGLVTWHIYEMTGYPPSKWHSFWRIPMLMIPFIGRIVIGILLPMYFIIVIRSELLAIKGETEQPAMTADDETRVVMDAPIVKEQDQRYNFVYSSPEFEPKVNRTPLFPVEELRIERLRQELE